jgi:hypothetical protein
LDDEVEFGLVSALHSTWKSCLSSITPTSAEAAETSLTIACAKATDGDVITLEPFDALYTLEFYRLFKPNKSSTDVRLEWHATSIPSILRDLLADKTARLAVPFTSLGVQGLTYFYALYLDLPARKASTPPSKQTPRPRNSPVTASSFSFSTPKISFTAPYLKFPKRSLDRNAPFVLRLFEQHVPGVPWAIPGQSSTHRGVALYLSLASRFGDEGYRAFGAYYEDLSDTNRIVMFVQTIAAQVCAVLIDTLTI